jgi:tetratricopeptide (TPR) repeat protein
VGTAIDFYSRWEMLPEDKAERLRQIERLYAMAPLQYGVARQYVISKYSEHPAPAEFETPMAPFLAYYFPALRWQAELSKDKPEEFVRIYRRLAEVDPNEYVALSTYLREHNRPAEAARAFQLAIDRGADSVMVANTCDWLINYYYDHGETDRALGIAKMAAEVYSQGGLESMARLMEQMKRWDEAESYHLKIAERYNYRGSLRAYYARRAKADPASPEAEKLKVEAKSVFPTGMRQAILADLVTAGGPPAKGVLMRGETDLTRKFGLQSEAIIVALDGVSTETVEQFQFVRALSDSPEMAQIVWQNGAYQEIHAHVPGRRFGTKIFPWP